MVAKQKTCLGCGKQCYLWISKPHCLCKDCAAKKKLQEQGPVIQKKREPINKLSDKQAKLNAAYKVLRDQFMKGKQCQANWEGCTKIATECHHAGGRQNGNMLDSSTYRALCHNCHSKVETQPERAKKENLSIDRLTNKA